MGDDLSDTQTMLLSPAEPVLPGVDRIAGRYTLHAQIGVGGMGAVYLAMDHDLDEIVALKTLRPELARRPGLVKRFRQEVKLARRVTHPNVVRTFDLGEFVATDGAVELFLTMEYIDGQPLTEVIADRGRLTPAEIEPFLRGICAGLGAAHDAGVVHRDLKPDNILVDANGRVVLTDFGIARTLFEPEAASLPGQGTPAYMAPEQDRGAPTDQRTDVYSLGAILFELLTGARAWTGEDPLAASIARSTRTAPDPRATRPEVSVPIADVVRRCLARDPSDRYTSAREVLDAWVVARSGAAPTAYVHRPRGEAPRARSLAVLALRSDDENDEDLARGFSEELVDAFSRIPALRVRPMARPAGDPRAVGLHLRVEIVVDGMLRRTERGHKVTLRTISVADGYQVGAWTFESADPLDLVDQAAGTVATALTLQHQAPSRPASDPRAVDLYLRGKAILRANWFHPELAIPVLAEAELLAPDDPDLLATLGVALARRGLFARGRATEFLDRARSYAERAVSLGSDRGESWFALGATRLYGNDPLGGALALKQAVTRSPGHAKAQHLLGGLLVEAGRYSDALYRLQTATELDPMLTDARIELARLHALQGEWDRVLPQLSVSGPTEGEVGRLFAWARLRMWNPSLPAPPPVPDAPDAPPSRQFVAGVVAYLTELVETRALPTSTRTMVHEGVTVEVGRLYLSRLQIQVETLLFVGEAERALTVVQHAVDAGLTDLSWLDGCPLFDPVRRHPEWIAARREVARMAEPIGRAGAR